VTVDGRLRHLHSMEESKVGPYDLQEAVCRFMARKVGLLAVGKALERHPESAKGLTYTVRRSDGVPVMRSWFLVMRLGDEWGASPGCSGWLCRVRLFTSFCTVTAP